MTRIGLLAESPDNNRLLEVEGGQEEALDEEEAPVAERK
jgi:hypothetical protein